MQQVQLVPARYVTIKLAAALTGLTDKAIERKIGDGVWAEGRQYVRRAGRLFVDMRGYETWVESGKRH